MVAAAGSNQTPKVRTTATPFSFNASTNSLNVNNLSIGSAASGWEIDGSSNSILNIKDLNDTVRFTILSTGNVGIGTITPTEKLEVSGNSKATRFISTETTGTSPFDVSSTTLVTNLNADSVDGLHSSSFVQTSGTQTIAGDKTFSNNVIVTGNLTINGTTTNINTTNLVVEDKNIIIGDVTTPSDVTADGGGITLKGATDKTITWVDSTDRWTSNQVFGAPNFVSTVAIGTQPYAATSTTVNTNLNADLLDGQHGSYYAPIASPSFTGSVTIDGLSLQDTATVTTTSTTQTALASYAVATYATGKFLIQATQGSIRQISELLVTHNGTLSTATEYGIVKTGATLYNVTTDISGGNVRVLVTSTSATSTVYRTSFTLIGV
jgi:hypothetical protein